MTHARVHLALAVIWTLLLIPTLVWWRESILWIAFMSWYAIVTSHWSAFEAAKAKEQVEKGE